MPLVDDVRSAEALNHPFAFFRRLREHDPVHWSESSGAWILSSHAAVADAFKDDRLSSDRLTPIESRMSEAERAGMVSTFQLLRGWMVFHDPPEHGRLRDPVRRVFTPRRIERLAPRIRSIVDELLDAMARKECVDLVPAFAFPLPAIVIAELLGIPAEDRERFKTWSRKLAGLVFGAVEREERNRAASEATREFTDYFEGLIRAREAKPGDDLVSALVAARDRGDSLSAEQLVGACTMLLFGGHETTATLIANAAVALLEHPEELARLRRDPALAPLAVEEVMRFDGPATLMVRHARETHERGGHRLRAGERVYLAIAGANRDPAVFPEADRFDVGRDPNPHLGFGLGRHFCLGAALARLEARIAIAALLERFPGLRLGPTAPQRVASIIGRGHAAVPVALGAAH